MFHNNVKCILLHVYVGRMHIRIHGITISSLAPVIIATATGRGFLPMRYNYGGTKERICSYCTWKHCSDLWLRAALNICVQTKSSECSLWSAFNVHVVWERQRGGMEEGQVDK